MTSAATQRSRSGGGLARVAALFVVLGTGTACVDRADGAAMTPEEVALLDAIFTAEDARPSSVDSLAPLYDGLASGNSEIRRFSVRALGRLERAALLPAVAPYLDDPEERVRAEAANALAQAVLRAEPAEVAEAREVLLLRLSSETAPLARSAIALSVGRTRHGTALEVRESAERIAGSAGAGATGLAAADGLAAERFAKALFFLARQPAARGALPGAALGWLRDAVRLEAETGEVATTQTRIRTLAVAALGAAGQASTMDLQVALDAAHPLVRREAIVAAPALGDRDAALAMLARGLEDSSAMVRYEALRGWRRAGVAPDCDLLSRSVADPDAHVALLAIDLLVVCTETLGVIALLDGLVLSLPRDSTAGAWHRAAHALVVLAELEGGLAATRIPPFVTSRDPFVRTWAAKAVGILGDTRTLESLGRDPDPNVRTAAIGELARIQGREADAILVEQLAQDDPQLLMTAAELLAGTREPGALPGLLAALDRVSALRRETSRDARRALLSRIAELGSRADTAHVSPYLADFDPMIASRAADLIGTWTGERPEPLPTQLAPRPHPAVDTLYAMARARFVIEMSDGAEFELQLRPWDAPTNSFRFVNLVEAGHFDGLTYHRVVPNFVVQGGSPAANEYAGDGPFSRDELGLEGNWRGTVGVSTRGRDTGDGQMFINTVDNIRLDHEYTVFAEVVRGMDVVDQILEGATIRRIYRR